MKRGEIVIEPFDRDSLGTNSYDVHLSRHLATYRDRVLDARVHNEIDHFDIRKLHPENQHKSFTLCWLQ